MGGTFFRFHLSLERVCELPDLRLLLCVHGRVRVHLLVPQTGGGGSSQLQVFRFVLSQTT